MKFFVLLINKKKTFYKNFRFIEKSKLERETKILFHLKQILIETFLSNINHSFMQNYKYCVIEFII